MGLVVRPKLKTKLETKARGACKTAQINSRRQRGFHRQDSSTALPSLSCHCKMKLLISSAKGEKKTKNLIQRENLTQTGLQVGQQWGAGISHGDKLSPCAPLSPCPKDAHFYFPSGATSGPILTYIHCLWKKRGISYHIFLQHLGGTAAG